MSATCGHARGPRRFPEEHSYYRDPPPTHGLYCHVIGNSPRYSSRKREHSLAYVRGNIRSADSVRKNGPAASLTMELQG